MGTDITKQPMSLLQVKYKNDDLFSFSNIYLNGVRERFVIERNKIIKDAFINAGVNIDDIEFIKKNVTKVMVVGSKTEHYYLYHGTANEQRIISIEQISEVTESNGIYTIRSKFY